MQRMPLTTTPDLCGPNQPCIRNRWGCTLAPPGEYDWTIRVLWRCGRMLHYFDHWLILLFLLHVTGVAVWVVTVRWYATWRTPVCTDVCRRWLRYAIRRSVRGDTKRLAAIWAPTRLRGRYVSLSLAVSLSPDSCCSTLIRIDLGCLFN